MDGGVSWVGWHWVPCLRSAMSDRDRRVGLVSLGDTGHLCLCPPTTGAGSKLQNMEYMHISV